MFEKKTDTKGVQGCTKRHPLLLCSITSNSLSNKLGYLQDAEYFSQVWNKFDDVQPYLEHIEHMIHDFVGERIDIIPRTWNNDTATECMISVQSDTMSVQEAVTLMLQEYRLLMISDFCYCRNTNNTSAVENEKRVEIVRMMANFESSIWENEWYQLIPTNYSWLYEPQTSTNTCTSNDNNLVADNVIPTTERTTDETRSGFVDDKNEDQLESPMNDIAFDSPATQESRNWCTVDSSSNYANLMTEPINEDVERNFLEEMAKNGDEICNGDTNDPETEEALRILFGSELHEEGSVKPDTNSNHVSIPTDSAKITVTEETESITNGVENRKICPSQYQEACKNSNEISMFANGVKRKCRVANHKLTMLQKSMLNRVVAQYRDMVETRSLSMSEALEYVDKVVDYLVSDARNSIAV